MSSVSTHEPRRAAASAPAGSPTSSATASAHAPSRAEMGRLSARIWFTL